MVFEELGDRQNLSVREFAAVTFNCGAKCPADKEETLLNHITIMGRLTRDPEYRTTSNGTTVVNFSVAVDRDFSGKDGGEKETDFIDCVAWRKTAEFITKYFTKGSLIVVSGRLQIRSWVDDNNNKRRTAEIVAENCYFGSSKNAGAAAQSNDSDTGYNAFPQTEAYIQSRTATDFVMLDDADAQLPF